MMRHQFWLGLGPSGVLGIEPSTCYTISLVSTPLNFCYSPLSVQGTNNQTPQSIETPLLSVSMLPTHLVTSVQQNSRFILVCLFLCLIYFYSSFEWIDICIYTHIYITFHLLCHLAYTYSSICYHKWQDFYFLYSKVIHLCRVLISIFLSLGTWVIPMSLLLQIILQWIYESRYILNFVILYSSYRYLRTLILKKSIFVYILLYLTVSVCTGVH